MTSPRSWPASRLTGIALLAGLAAIAAGLWVSERLPSALAATLAILLSLAVALAVAVRHARRAASRREARSAEMTEAQQALDSVTDGVIVYDSHWRFMLLNRSAMLVATRPREQLIGKVLWECYPELIGSEFHRNYLEALREQRPRAFEYFSPPTGQWLELRLFPRTDRITVVLRDVSVQRSMLAQLETANQEIAQQLARSQEIAESLRESNMQLGERNRQLQEFAHIASHDLQEPLRKIQVFGALLRDQAPPLAGAAGEYLQRMLAATERMQALISSLLVFARVGAAVPGQSRVDLAQLVEEAVAELLLESNGPAPQIAVQPLPTVVGDAVLLRQVIQNLLANAFKFVKPGEIPRVEIGGEVFGASGGSRDWCRIHVRDHGIGFDPRESEAIFDLFRRLHGRDSYAGSGIGLAIVRRIVEVHGGRVRATGVLGEGACFEIELPLLPAPASAAH